MKTIWMALILIFVMSIESSALAQLIPRRTRTRPCPDYKLPSDQYTVNNRSRSITAFSNRFVYFDNPLALLNQSAQPAPTKTTEIKTITTEKQASNQMLLDALQAEKTGSTGSGTKPNGSGNVPAESAIALLTPGKITDKVTTTTESITDPQGSESGEIKRDKKLFQWSTNSLTLDHCAISNMSVRLSRNGEWGLNLRADQNRRTDNARYNPALFIKRNQFGIVLRCYGSLSATTTTNGLQTGNPVLVEIEVDKFWVQNGKPEYLVTSNNNSLIADHFDLIDRVEIEFFYYK